MQTNHLHVLTYIKIKGEVGTVKLVPSKHAYMGPIGAIHMGSIWGVQPGSTWVPYGLSHLHGALTGPT